MVYNNFRLNLIYLITKMKNLKFFINKKVFTKSGSFLFINTINCKFISVQTTIKGNKEFLLE